MATYSHRDMQDDLENDTYVGSSMTSMDPMEGAFRIDGEAMLSVTIALTTDDVETIRQAGEELED